MAEIYNVNYSFVKSLGGFRNCEEQEPSFFVAVTAQLCRARFSYSAARLANRISPSASTGLSAWPINAAADL